MAQSTIIKARNNTGAILVAGTVVYISGYDDVGEVPIIALADHRFDNQMPAIGVVRQDILNGDIGVVKNSGPANSFDTTEALVNDNVYVGQNGGITFDNPSTNDTANLTQQIGTVRKVDDFPDGELQLLPLEITKSISHSDLINVLDDQHHVKLHSDQHESGGLDQINHDQLGNLNLDSHNIYSLSDGTRAYTGVVSGVTPTSNAHLATKAYVDLVGGGGGGGLSSGVAGSIQFSDGLTAFDSDGANLFWDDANNRLGIGTASPSEMLTVNGNISIAGNIINSDLTETFQVIRKDLDGYASEQTVSEHYTQHSDAIQTILKDLDGYALDSNLTGLETTVSEHYTQHSDAIQTILKDLDGYASEQTVSEHYTQHSDAIQTVLKDLDGYASSGVTGSVQFSDGADSFLSDDTQFFWDAANNRLGIGTDAPSNKLHVRKDVNTGGLSGATLFLENQDVGGVGDAGVIFRIPAQDWFAGIDNSDSDAFRIVPASDATTTVLGLTVLPTGNTIVAGTAPGDLIKATFTANGSGAIIARTENAGNATISRFIGVVDGGTAAKIIDIGVYSTSYNPAFAYSGELDLSGAVVFSDLTSGTTKWIFGPAGAAKVVFGNNNAHRLTIGANGNVMIGTDVTQAANLLDVDGSVAIGGTYAGVNAAPANGLIVQGNVGIGTPTATTALAISGTGAVVTASTLTNTTSGGWVTRSFHTDGLPNLWLYNFSSGYSATTMGGFARTSTSEVSSRNQLFIDTVTSVPIRMFTNNIHALTIDTSQRVGIGTATPATKLDVNGNASISQSLTVGGDIINDALTEGINTILKDLDGYALLTTENQRWTDSSQQRQDLRNAADGYALSADLTILTTTVDQHWVDSSQQRQDLRDAADGYGPGSVTSAQGSDGYVAFFTGPDAIAGDNDLFFDRPTNKLIVNNGARFARTGNTPSDPSISFGSAGNSGFYAFSDSILQVAISGAAKWQFNSTGFTSNEGGAELKTSSGSSTNASVRPIGSINSGLGAGGNVFNASVLSDGVEGIRVAESNSNIRTSFFGNSSADEILTVTGEAGGGTVDAYGDVQSHSGIVAIAETVAPLSLSGFGKLYVSSGDNNIHFLDSLGADTDLTAGITATQGSDGYIAFFTGSGSIAGDNDLFYNRVTGAITLGGATVGADGYINPVADVTGGLGTPALRWEHLITGPDSIHLVSTDAETGVGRDWNIGIGTDTGVGNLIIHEGNKTNFTIDTAGNVGIGTFSPGTRLHVYKSQNNGGLSGATLLLENPNVGVSGDAGVVYRIPAQDWYAGVDNDVGDGFRIAPYADATTGVLGLTVLPTGNIGIGVSPTNTLTVAGGITVDGTTGTYEAGVLGYTNTNWGFIYRPPQVGGIGAHLFESFAGADLVVIEDGGNVGIGITTPDALLHVHVATAGVVAATAGSTAVLESNGNGYLQFLTPASADTGILFGDPGNAAIGQIRYSHVVDNMRFYTGGTQRVVIDSGGSLRVGAGVTTSTRVAGLHVGPSANSSVVATDASADDLVLESSGATGMTILSGNTTTGRISFADNNSNLQGMVQYNHSTNELVFWTLGAEAARFSSAKDLQLVGNLYKNNATGVLQIAGGSSITNGANIELYGGSHVSFANQAYYDAVSHNFRAQAAGTVYMTLNATGLGVGVSPSVRLDVSNSVSSGYVAKFNNVLNSDLANGIIIQCGNSANTGTTNYIEARNNSGTATGAIRTVTGVFAIVDQSDERRKKLIAPTKIDGLQTINGIDVIEFAYKEHEDSDMHPVGFSAQQLETVFPYMVTHDTEPSDEDPEPMKMINKTHLIPVLVKAVQELTDKVNSLQRRLDVINKDE